MSRSKRVRQIEAAQAVLIALGLPSAQHNERSALSLLALLDLRPGAPWTDAQSPLIGITPIMDWIREHYAEDYAPNTRETFRRQTMHQFVDAGIVTYNPDDPMRAVNSPRAAYQVEPTTLALLRRYGTSAWDDALAEYAESRVTLVEQYAKARQLHRVPVQISSDQVIDLGPGAHSQLIRAVIEEFAPRFAPGSVLVYVGDTDSKWSYCDKELMAELGIAVDPHGKMPDVVLYFRDRDWLLLVEAVTSHGPVDGKRFQELSTLFAGSTAGLVFVTAFPDRSTFSRYQAEIAWETEVWVADAPSHMVHFNGDRFLGPYG